MTKSQPPYTPEQARARSREAPKTSPGTFAAGTAGPTKYGKGGSGSSLDKHMFKPGVRTGATGPESGKNK